MNNQSFTQDSINHWVAIIDEHPDMLHNDYTPAVWKLSETGVDGIRALIPLLSAANEDTRMHAQRALELIVNRMNGWVPAHGFPKGSDGQAKVQQLISETGSYQYDADSATRDKSISLWKKWLEKQPAH